MYGKLINDQIVIAPRNYENISNFNLNPEVMEEYGFSPVVELYNKTNGEIVYFFESDLPTVPGIYTDLPYPGEYYIWNEAEGCWEFPLDIAKERKSEEIRKAADEEVLALRKGYSQSEQETWARQEKGAKDLAADSKAMTDEANWVRHLAEARGIDVTTQVSKILNAVAYANEAAYKLVGRQQRLEDMIRACTTITEVEAIYWDMEITESESNTEDK